MTKGTLLFTQLIVFCRFMPMYYMIKTHSDPEFLQQEIFILQHELVTLKQNLVAVLEYMEEILHYLTNSFATPKQTAMRLQTPVEELIKIADKPIPPQSVYSYYFISGAVIGCAATLGYFWATGHLDITLVTRGVKVLTKVEDMGDLTVD